MVQRQTTLRKTLIRVACGATLVASLPGHAGDLNAEVDAMFSDLGAIGNYTAPGAFKGQTMGVYSGGSLYMRSPNKTYQLAAIEFPSLKAGCGGIDLFGGSFSHISSDEFKNMLKNITAALPGIAFQLALETVSPMLGGLTKWAESLQSVVNNARINSCETATALVSSAAEAAGFDTQRACAKLAVQLGRASDYEAGLKLCQSDKPSILNTARTSTDPEIKAQAPFVGNATWQALKKVDTLDDRARELVMSITGAVIFPPESANKGPTIVAPTITKVAHLLYGQSSAGENINVGILRCNNYTECDVVTNSTTVHEPLNKKVADLMSSISQKIRDRQPIPNNSLEVGFVNTTSLPVWRMLSVGNTIPGSGLAELMIANYRDVIAADYAFTFLNQFANVALGALAQTYNMPREQGAHIDKQRMQVRAFMSDLQREQTALYTKVGSVSRVVDDLERYERALRASMSQQVIDMLGFASRSMK